MGLTKAGTTKPKAVKAKPASGKMGPKGDTANIVRAYLYAMREVGMESVDQADVLLQTGYARADSTGYRTVMKELTTQLKHVSRRSGQLSLTPEGVTYHEQHGTPVEVTKPNMEAHQNKLLESLIGNANAPEDRIRAVWTLLLDGRPHEMSALLQASRYSRPDSTGFREMKKWLKKLDLVAKGPGKGSWVFTDKVYKFGARPSAA